MTFDRDLVGKALEKEFTEWTDEERKAMEQYHAEKERISRECLELENKKRDEIEKRKEELRAEGEKRLKEYNQKLREYDNREREKDRMKETNPVQFFINQIQLQKPIEFYHLALSVEQASLAMEAAYQAEVVRNGRKNVYLSTSKHVIYECSRWLTNKNRETFGMILQGNVGVGKTTLLNAMMRTINSIGGNNVKMIVVTADEIAEKCRDDKEAYKKLCKTPLLGIDDIGTESTSVKDYGNELTPISQLILKRYEKRLFTVITTNLQTNDIDTIYGTRVFDRLRECSTIKYASITSYRCNEN